MKILAKIVKGQIAFSEYNLKVWNDYKKNAKNEGSVIAIQDRIPDSKNIRGFYHGGVLPLWAYLNGWDYRSGEVIGYLHEDAKREFNGEIVLKEGKPVKIGKSTKGLLAENDQQNSGYVERVISYLEQNYAIDRNKVLNHNHYKWWRDTIRSFGANDCYIDYLIEVGTLPKQSEISLLKNE